LKLLFEVTHPKHVHLFRHAIEELRRRGHDIRITARRKDITTDLLDAFGLEYECISERTGGISSLAKELIVRDWRLWKIARRFRPDIIIGRVGTSAAHVGFLIRRPVLVFEDTEHAWLQQWITFPLTTRIFTSMHYEKDWGRKHDRYASFDELAYLHPKRFRPDPEIANQFGIRADGPYILVRFVSWQAAHDDPRMSANDAEREHLVRRLEAHGRVWISSEGPLPDSIAPNRLPTPPHQFHHILAFARLYFGDSTTVGCEAALLGVPAVVANPLYCGYLRRLEMCYELCNQFDSFGPAIDEAERLLTDPSLPRLCQERRNRLLDRESDLTEWMVDRIEAAGPKRKIAAGDASKAVTGCC
jgi:hypothetical protein